MSVRLHEIEWAAVTDESLMNAVDRGELDNGVGVVDVVDWLHRAQHVPRERNPYVARHRADGPAA